MVVYISPQMRQAMEEQRGHDEIARRAIYINICLFLPWVFYSGKYTEKGFFFYKLNFLIAFSHHWQQL